MPHTCRNSDVVWRAGTSGPDGKARRYVTGRVALRVGVDGMGQRARLTNRNRTIPRRPIRAPDLARRMAELQALREMVRRAETRSDSEVRRVARIRSFV
jgi:hypothetical protein